MNNRESDESSMVITGKIIRKAGGLAFISDRCEFFLPILMGKAVWCHKDQINRDVHLRIPAQNIHNDPCGACDEVQCDHSFFRASLTSILTEDDEPIFEP